MDIHRVYIETLGCNKNTVDSEVIITLLKKKGAEIIDNPEVADCVIVNTCGFIDEAKEESINTILSLAKYKNIRRRKHQKLYVTGCFSQLYHEEILKEIPEVDAVFGVGDFNPLIDAAVNKDNSRTCYDESFKITPHYKEYDIGNRYITTQGFAYIKIAEGCNRKCSFCLIPKIKGQFRSRKISSITDEIKRLEEKNIYEIILVSQDTLSYGMDIEIKDGLIRLLEEVLKKTNVNWIRLLYLRPTKYILRFLNLFKDKRLLPYFDIPIQHSSNKILKQMNREGKKEEYLEIIERIRDEIPEAVIRTSVIVGFPGEEQEDFEELKNFIQKAKFNHIGIFTYSPQEGTKAFRLKKRVAKSIAQSRSEELYLIQSEISNMLLSNEIGKKHQVLIEEKLVDEDVYFGRSYHFAPEVDGIFVVNSKKNIKVPALVNCMVKRTETYDLHGELI